MSFQEGDLPGLQTAYARNADDFVTDFIITSTNIDVREGVWDWVDSYRKIVLIGDKEYIGNTLASDL